MNGKRRLLGSFTHGSMANAVPQAIGAQAAYPGRAGHYVIGRRWARHVTRRPAHLEAGEAAHQDCCFNNSSLGFVELEMKAAGLLEFGTDLQNPSFAELANACGILGLRVGRPEQLPDATQRALAHDGPALLDVVVNRQELSMPPTIKFGQMAGFGLYIMRAVMNGRADEIIDLAKTNLFR